MVASVRAAQVKYFDEESLQIAGILEELGNVSGILEQAHVLDEIFLFPRVENPFALLIEGMLEFEK